ncbi:MAG: N-acetylglucosamine-6-phosphate deacetylase [Verrucomicrobiota bacterium]
MDYFDLQVNGYAGVDFCSSKLTLAECRSAGEALRADGIGSFLVTLITDEISSLESKLSRWVGFLEEDELLSEWVAGFHLEGPFISPRDGFVGAHAAESVVPANVERARRLIDAGEGRVKLVTLAPEWDEKAETTRFLASQGITVSAGHCDPDLETLQRSIDEGLSMVTHLGNGCPVMLPRHDNFIQRALSLSEALWFSFIPDGIHVPWFALENMIALVGREKTIMTTDAIMAAGLSPGSYELSGFPVEIDHQGVARRPGSSNFAGSTLRGFQVPENLREKLGFSQSEIQKVYQENPRQALGL